MPNDKGSLFAQINERRGARAPGPRFDKSSRFVKSLKTMTIQPLQFGQYYHIYNRGNNRENLFAEQRNYPYFLKLYAKHILPVAKTFAYCLLPNHFHFAFVPGPRPSRKAIGSRKSSPFWPANSSSSCANPVRRSKTCSSPTPALSTGPRNAQDRYLHGRFSASASTARPILCS